MKEVKFIGSAERDFDSLPGDVYEEANQALTNLQNNRRPAAGRYTELTGNAKLNGVAEIRSNGADGNTYRVYTVIIFKEIIYVLDAGAKKSSQGGSAGSDHVQDEDRRIHHGSGSPRPSEHCSD
jgi:phage-related protein